MRESQQKTEKIIADLSKNVGGINNSLGQLTETLFSGELWKLFHKYNIEFTKQAPRVQFIQNKQVIAEADYFLENGDCAMPVEVKTALSINDVDNHLARIDKIRRYMDGRNDMRKLYGAVAGGVVTKNVMEYAQSKGLYVIVQTGESITTADPPAGFSVREWTFET